MKIFSSWKLAAGVYLFNVDNKDSRTDWLISHWSGVVAVVDFEQVNTAGTCLGFCWTFNIDIIQFTELYVSVIPTWRKKWDKLFKNGPSKICGRQPLKKFKVTSA